jgi:hypothetical protein
MAAQPHKDTHATGDRPPVTGAVERDRTDIGVVSFMGAVALTVAVGMWFYTKDKEMIAGDGTTVTQTTGARSSDDTGPHVAPRSNAPGFPAASPPHE